MMPGKDPFPAGGAAPGTRGLVPERVVDGPMKDGTLSLPLTRETHYSTSRGSNQGGNVTMAPDMRAASSAVLEREKSRQEAGREE
jgi:hypothetical protein